MACCLLLCSPEPIPDHPNSGRLGTFQISMVESLYKNQPACLCSYLFPCCSAAYVRYRVLNRDLSRYTCCQGYFDNACCRSGCLEEQQCPSFCLGLEVFCCLGPSISASRLYTQDMYDIRPDPCDYRVIRFSNCLNMLSCLCSIAALFHKDLQHLAHTLRVLSDMVFYSTFGCMASQVLKEVKFQEDLLLSSSSSSSTTQHAIGYSVPPDDNENKHLLGYQSDANQPIKRYE